MTLDEAIKHCEEVAEENQAIVDSCDYYGENMAKCEECAKEHRQLATWLRELKAYKEQQPSEDCISREEALETIEKYADEYERRANRIDTANPEYPAYHAKKRWNGIALGLDKAKELLTDLPPVAPQPKEEPQQKTGHWIEHKHGGIEHIECSKCRCWFLRKELIRNSYCPNCGSYNGGTK